MRLVIGAKLKPLPLFAIIEEGRFVPLNKVQKKLVRDCFNETVDRKLVCYFKGAQKTIKEKLTQANTVDRETDKHTSNLRQRELAVYVGFEGGNAVISKYLNPNNKDFGNVNFRHVVKLALNAGLTLEQLGNLISVQLNGYEAALQKTWEFRNRRATPSIILSQEILIDLIVATPFIKELRQNHWNFPNEKAKDAYRKRFKQFSLLLGTYKELDFVSLRRTLNEWATIWSDCFVAVCFPFEEPLK